MFPSFYSLFQCIQDFFILLKMCHVTLFVFDFDFLRFEDLSFGRFFVFFDTVSHETACSSSSRMVYCLLDMCGCCCVLRERERERAEDCWNSFLLLLYYVLINN